MNQRVLLVDDDGEGCLSLARALKAAGLDASIDAASSAEGALKLLKSHPPAVVVLDLSIDDRIGVESGFALLSQIVSFGEHIRVVLLTGHGAVEYGVRALKLGAANFLEKPAHVPHLIELVRDGIRQNQLLQSAFQQQIDSFGDALVGTSPTIAAVRGEIAFAAQTTQSVFLSGETGVGKGVCARLIHGASRCQKNNFVRYQAMFTSADLVASDLFGHKKGSYTGATEERNGFLAAADGGTFFLDEIDELPSETQVLLLGVLQDKRYRPVGATKEESSNFRLISASNRTIESALNTGKMRQDLYHRIANIVITIPPLRDRIEDIPELATHILSKFSRREELNVFSISENALTYLREQRWPGNVRELEAAVEGAAWRAHFRGETALTSRDFPAVKHGATLQPSANLESQVDAFRLKIIEDSLARNNGNQVKTALELGCDRSTMRRILKRAVA